MRAGMILAAAARRMWRLWVPSIFILLAVSVVTASAGTGVSLLALLAAGGLVLTSLGDWCTSEQLAYRAERSAATS